MSEQTARAVDLAATWKRLFEEYDPARESILGICTRFGLSPGSWSYWRRKLGVAGGPQRQQTRRRGPAFAELVVREDPQQSGAGVEIALVSGAIVRVGIGSSERELAMVLKALGAC